MPKPFALALLPGLVIAVPAMAQKQLPPILPAVAQMPLPLAAPALTAPPSPTPFSPAPVLQAPAPALSPAAVEAESARLHRLFQREIVAHAVTLSPAQQGSFVDHAWAEIKAAGQTIDAPQLIVAVDRNPRVQVAAILLARPTGPWEVIGSAHVSTGQAGRFDHYITPTGVFVHSDAILDYRAEGTFNENHIRGYGVKGMRIWDFGWQNAAKGWREDRGPMRLLMHATDPEILDPRIGRPASQGCVRIPAALNRFLDHFGVLDADYEKVAKHDIRYRALLAADRAPTPLAGRMMVVFDSSEAV